MGTAVVAHREQTLINRFIRKLLRHPFARRRFTRVRKAGFRLEHEARGMQWGTEVNEQRFELNLLRNPPASRTPG